MSLAFKFVARMGRPSAGSGARTAQKARAIRSTQRNALRADLFFVSPRALTAWRWLSVRG